MTKSEKVFSLLKEKRLIGLLAPISAKHCVTAYEYLSPLGVVLEIAFRTDAAAEGIKILMRKYPDALVLAGTVMMKKQAEMAIDFGVAGIVSADYIPEVVETCMKNEIMCVPGGTADCGKQLVQKANLYGCDLVELKERYPYQWCYKLFPAATSTSSNVGLAKAWKGPFKELTLVYTGGVSLTNLAEVSSLDPDGIFCGSAVTKAIDEPEKMVEEAKKWLEIIHQIKKKSDMVLNRV
jgi:2-keto-3-deoxy-6-phosphogluconate aldolase